MEIKTCPDCYARNNQRRRTCWRCGHAFTQHEPTGSTGYYVPSHAAIWKAIMSFLTNHR